MSPSRRPGGPRLTTARGLAAQCLLRVDEGAYANLAVPGMLERSRLSDRDRAFVTELVYGTVRMRRACDWLVDPHLRSPVDPTVRALLRLGAYQLAFAGTPAHAGVSATVDEAPYRARGLVNAVLRQVARRLPPAWPDLATELSYPDWIVATLERDLGPSVAHAALRSMNEAATVVERPDGYIQDPASQAVARYAAGHCPAGGTVVDLCAAPGGKTTLMAAGAGGEDGERGRPRRVVAMDIRPARVRMIGRNAARLGLSRVVAVTADGRLPPLRPAGADVVLVDAPCSGLGALRRRPDARWRIAEASVAELASLQQSLLAAAMGLVRPGGVLVYSVCTLTAAETVGVDEWMAHRYPDAVPLAGPVDPSVGKPSAGLAEPWAAWGRGSLLLPQRAGTDGMFCLGLRIGSRAGG